MAQTKPKAGQFYGVSNNGTDGQFLQTDGTGGMAWASTIVDPTITSIDYPGSTTAADPAGGQSVIINGTLFASGITCTVGGTSAVTAFNSATQITITTPAKAAGPYTIAVANTDGGTASENNFIQYSGVPVWSTAAGTLGNVIEGGAASFQVTATEGSDTIEYAVTTGTLPTGLSLATATGAITGTAPTVSADTTTTFSITATDDENQTSASRSFSITVQNDPPSNHFSVITYTGTGATQSTNSLSNQSGTINFKPDLIWFKDRGGTYSHSLYNSISGRDRFLRSNSANSESTGASATEDLVSFDTNGFTLGTDYHTVNNANGRNYVSWNFKAGGAAVANTDGTLNTQVSVNNTLGFSIATYTGNSTNGATVGHGLDSAPEMIIVKMRNVVGSSKSWTVYVEPLGNTRNLYLQSANAASVYNFWANTSPTNSVFSVSSDTNVNSSAGNYVAYSFTSKPGFSKVGSYTGNGSVNGPIVQIGFEPAFLMIKRTDSAEDWKIIDNKRGIDFANSLEPNEAIAEQVGNNSNFVLTTNGFIIGDLHGDYNANGGTYIYLAFAADGSTSTPSLANSFATELYTGNGGTKTVTTGFKTDLVWLKSRTAAYPQYMADSVRGTLKVLRPSEPDAQSTGTGVSSFGSTSFNVTGGGENQSGGSYVSWNFKAGGTPSINTDGSTTSLVSANQAAGFSIVQFSGNLSSAGNIQVGHGLNVAPELIIQKNINGTGTWWARPFFLNSNPYQYLGLSESAALVTSSSSDGTMSIPTSTTFDNNWNTSLGGPSGTPIIAYCFKSISGFSKVGSYSGNQSLNVANQINFGFTPGFVMIKNTTNSSSQWIIFDSARTNGYALYANSNSTESNYSTDLLLSSQGLEFKSTNINVNQSGATYIYLAIKEN